MTYRALFLITSSAAIAGCASSDVVREAEPLSAVQLYSKRDSIVAQMKGTTIDDYFEVLARLLPGGFGGLTASYVWMKDPSQASEMARTANVLAACPSGGIPYLALLQGGNVMRGAYDWVELRTWYRQILASGPFGGNSADIDEGVNRLTFTFTTQAELEQFRARVTSLGVPAGALNLEIRGPAVPL